MQEGLWPPPPQRRARQQQPLFVDATDDFKRQCSALALGHMVHPSTFTLLDSMTCISISDPRMDLGIYPPPQDLIPEPDRITRQALPDFDPRRLYTVADVLWIMDRLMACEVAFHQSVPLAQTLFTCLLYHSVRDIGKSERLSPLVSLEEANATVTGFVLRAYVVATIKCFGLTWQELIKGNIMEGEDASTDACNLPLLEDHPVEEALNDLQTALAWVQDASLHLPRDQRPAMEGLTKRLAMRSDILTVLALFSNALASDVRGVGRADDFASIYFQLRRLSTQILERSNRLDLLNVDLKSAPSSAAASVFDPSYSRRLQNSGGLPPRPTELPSKEVTADFWKITTSDWAQAAAVYRMMTMGTGNKWEQMTALVESKGILTFERPTSAYFRSQLQPDLLADFFSSHTSEPSYILSRALQTLEQFFARPVSGRSGSDFSSCPPLDHQSVHWWLQKGEGLLASHILSCLANRPRAKRLVGKGYADWRQWAEQGCSIETQLLGGTTGHNRQLDELNRVFSSLNQAIDKQTLEMALFLIMSGFDLDLYSEEEKPVAYWLALKISLQADEGRSGISWRTECLRLWLSLTLRSLVDKETNETPQRRPNWIGLPSHRKAIFKRRFKWLRLPAQGQDGQRQDPESELDDLWTEWLQEEQARAEKASPDHERSTLLRQVSSARDAVQSRALEIHKGKRWTLCREDSQMLNNRILSTIEKIQAHLDEDDEKRGPPLQRRSGKEGEEVEDGEVEVEMPVQGAPSETRSSVSLPAGEAGGRAGIVRGEEGNHLSHPWFPLILPSPSVEVHVANEGQ